MGIADLKYEKLTQRHKENFASLRETKNQFILQAPKIHLWGNLKSQIPNLLTFDEHEFPYIKSLTIHT
jgi:hypothetical protein